ncbi:hypothetical protein EHQ93_07525 [Leptospira meyeri]|nr:hypothetical protein CH381_24235 [Leptospira sp. mixed culture ATI2-C-A1]TGM67807.1 hypothetical protein EHQ93_07525 [Leptospira meyeri]
MEGEWKIVGDVIYMRTKRNSNNENRFYLYVVREKELSYEDPKYSFLQNYDTEPVSRLKKIKK